MVRYALFLCTGVLAALCFAGSPGTAFSQPVPCNFAAKVQLLPPGFDPSSGNPPPQGAPVGQPYANDLNRAFAIAPPAFQTQLCGLDGVFIDQTVCSSWDACFGHSWGFRRRLGPGRYIGISVMLWSGQPVYSRFESALFRDLLPLGTVAFANANPGADTFAMTLLAALAHEMGHVRWYDIIDPGRTGVQNFGALCGGSFFDAWAGGAARVHPSPPWRELLTMGARQAHPIPDAHQSPPQIPQIDAQVQAGHTLQAGDLLDWIYKPSAPWASFFAAISPDEDFVETYKFKVLTSAAPPLTSLPIQFPGTLGVYNEDIPAAYSQNLKPQLASKVNCIPL
jgi:hypothetical protein